MSLAAKRGMVSGRADLRAALGETSTFSPEKYPGLEPLLASVGNEAARVLDIEGLNERSVTFVEAEVPGPTLYGEGADEENLHLNVRVAGCATPGTVLIRKTVFYHWYTAVLGGAANPETIYPERPPTEFEQGVAMVMARAVCDCLVGALAALGVSSKIELTVPPPEEPIQVSIRDSGQFCIYYDVRLGEVAGEIVLVLPERMLLALKAAEAVPSEPKEAQGSERDPRWDEALNASLARTKLSLEVGLGACRLDLGGASRLKVGEPLVLQVSGKPVCVASLEQRDQRLALVFNRMAEGQ